MKIAGAAALLVVILGIGYFVFGKHQNNSVMPRSEQEGVIQEITQGEDIETQLDETLNVLLRLHHISLEDIPKSDPNRVILDELQESMNDVNKLKGLKYQTETLSKSQNELIATTNFALDVSVLQLIGSYEKWIEYLRSVDIYDINVSEFQYQIALFQTSTHDVYLRLVEGASLLPMIVVQFAEDDGANNTVDEELRDHFSTKIDELFGDVLIADDLFHKETNNRYAIAVLIRNYKNFFISADKTQ